MRPALVLALLAAASLTVQAPAQTPPEKSDKPVTIAAYTAKMTHMPGFLPLDWDAATGKLYLEIPKLNDDIIYTDSLPFGTGSNDLGLDRGQVSEGRIVRFERTGPKVLLVEPNQSFRSSSTDAAEQLAVTQSFPTSVLWGFKVEAETGGAVLVDATDFFLSDVHRVVERLAALKQGGFHVDASRSIIALDDTKAFPLNTEVEAELTFVNESEAQGHFVSDVTPDPHAMTLRERHSFVALPPPGYTPRRFDPRAGYFPNVWRDYTTPLGEPLDQQFIVRHRLIKKDANCKEKCEAVAPIQYYVDRGAPEPIRTALLEGARWWDTAFQGAGWAPGTFRVDLLPADADPMDIRYNIIQWVHRYTRGWSYGEAVTDPRTGEIIKGNVTLGSLRGRQDYLIAEALLAPYDREHPLWTPGNMYNPSVACNVCIPGNDPMRAMVLQRIRQLAAHETGHTLGLMHNFAASSFPHSDIDQTISVMDYPHPWITLDKNGAPDLSHAYPAGIGLWDKVAIDYGYREFAPKADEHTALNKILTASQQAGIPYITDEDARPFGSAHPHAHLWDNGADPTAELLRIIDIRAAALKRFGENNIKPGTPMSQLEQTLVPLYLLHRYQTEATIKLIGGLNYEYNLRALPGQAGQPNPVIVPTKQQDAALDAVLKTLAPDFLTLPESLLAILPPVPPGYPRTQESFPSETGLTFDPVAAAEAAADLTLQVLFDPARASRIVQYHMREAKGPSLRVMMEKVSKATAERTEGGHTISSEIERAVEFRALESMLSLGIDPRASSQVRAIVRYHLDDLLHQWTTEPAPTDSADAIHRTAMVLRIQDFEKDPSKFKPAPPAEAPPGMPIGDDEIM